MLLSCPEAKYVLQMQPLIVQAVRQVSPLGPTGTRLCAGCASGGGWCSLCGAGGGIVDLVATSWRFVLRVRAVEVGGDRDGHDLRGAVARWLVGMRHSEAANLSCARIQATTAD